MKNRETIGSAWCIGRERAEEYQSAEYITFLHSKICQNMKLTVGDLTYVQGKQRLHKEMLKLSRMIFLSKANVYSAKRRAGGNVKIFSKYLYDMADSEVMFNDRFHLFTGYQAYVIIVCTKYIRGNDNCLCLAYGIKQTGIKTLVVMTSSEN